MDMLIEDPKERRRVAEIKYLRALFWLLGWKYTSSDILRSLLSPRGVARLRKFGLIETQKRYFASVIQLSTFGWNFVSELFLSNKEFYMWSEETWELFEKLTRRNKKTINWAKLHHDLQVQETVLKLLRGDLRPYRFWIYEQIHYDAYGDYESEIKEKWEEVEEEKPVAYISEYSFFRLGFQPATDAVFISYNERTEKMSIWGVEYESGQNRNIKRLESKIVSVVKTHVLKHKIFNGILIYGSVNNYRKAFKKIKDSIEYRDIKFSPPYYDYEDRLKYLDHYTDALLDEYRGTILGYEFYQPQPRNTVRNFILDVSKAFWPDDPSDFNRDLLRKLFTHLK